MNRLKKRWIMLNPKDRNRLMIIGLAVVIAAYTFAVYPRTSKALLHSENMIKRRLDRIQKRTQITKETDANVLGLEKKLGDLKKDLEVVRVRLNENMQGFAPTDSATVQQRLRLEISTLARRSGLQVVQAAVVDSKDTPGAGAVNRPGRPSLGMRNAYGRPLYELNAETTYWSLVRFLDELKRLTYHVTVVNLDVSVLGGGAAPTGKELPPLPSGQIKVNMVLTL